MRHPPPSLPMLSFQNRIEMPNTASTAIPTQIALLPNYPNPFNPETWIPYELSTDTDVRITIYNAQGVVIRTLQLGRQSAGYYTDRERAAYWDGRNALGEQVASGIYFLPIGNRRHVRTAQNGHIEIGPQELGGKTLWGALLGPVDISFPHKTTGTAPFPPSQAEQTGSREKQIPSDVYLLS